ncbi:MAG: tetratricopeptide repeat protein [Fimbriimonadales bacterium]
MLSRAVCAAGCLASFVFCRAPGQGLGHQTLISARSAIERIEGNDPEAKIERAESDFNAHMRAFAAGSEGMAPIDAASRWLALVDEAIAIPHRSMNGMMAGSPPVPIGTLSTVMLTLPRPEVWPEIRALVDQRPPSPDRTALQILCARLMGDDEAVVKLCEEYDRQAPKPEGLVRPGSPTTGVRVAALRRLGRLTAKEIGECLQNSFETQSSLPYLGDLFPDAGARQAMLDYIRQSDGNVFIRDRRNMELAKQVVLAHLKEFPNPVWSLAEGSDDLPYVQRLVDHYGLAKLLDPNASTGQARQIYFRGLVLAGKTDLAAKLLRPGPDNVRIDAEDWGNAPKNLDRSVMAVQAMVPNRDLWDLYVSAAVASGHIHEAIVRLEAQLASPKTTRRVKLGILGNLIDLHCRIGDLTGVAADMDATQKVKHLPKPTIQGPFSNDDYDPSYQTLKIGLASRDAGLIRRGLAYEKQSDDNFVDGDLFKVLLMRKRFADLERIETAALRKNPTNPSWESTFGEALCQIYYEANRPRDIVTLLKEFPYWPVNDLSKIGSGSGNGYSEDRDEEPSAGFYAAWALAKTGQKDLAVRTLRNVLFVRTVAPRPYELLNSLGDASTLKTYDELIRAHPFNAGPVLWKGDLLFRLGRTAEAEACVREAMVINPAEGFAYREKLSGLLGQILKKEGDLAGARHCADLVKGVGLAAQAVDLTQSGLLSKAEAVLKQAAAICPNDAAIQAQLADCLDKECRYAEAAKHLARAIAHLPSALGENSSGPETFRSVLYPWPQADEVLGALNAVVKANPKSAGAHYARGTVYSWLGHSKEAIADLEKCVSVDQHHLLAWQELTSLSGYGLVGQAQAQRFAFESIQLAPLSEPVFGAVNLAVVSDLGTAYNKLRSRLDGFPVLDDNSIFPLHASEPERREIGWLAFNRLEKSGRLVGEFFQYTSDIGLIAALFHRTGFPFE